ncbi:MAG: hypothetical protein LQ347_001981 [Umbilicaria vellea]|nr:MAG: hypothetical protein LQ347_001981 [Umbilicaria vellea]
MIVVKGSYGDEALKGTSALSAVSSKLLVRGPSLAARSGPPSSTKPLHINALKGKEVDKEQKNARKKLQLFSKNSTEKDRKKTRSVRRIGEATIVALHSCSSTKNDNSKSNSGMYVDLGMISTRLTRLMRS